MIRRVQRILASLLLGLVISQSLPEGANADSAIFVADLEGTPIPATSVGDYYCHDFDYPFVHCFATAVRLEKVVEGVLGPSSDPSVLGAAAVSYVKIYDYASYAGSLAYISQTYGNLGDIGWNDRISSYIALNRETGAFYTDSWYSGSIDYFCCNQGVASLSSTFDNRITSVKRT